MNSSKTSVLNFTLGPVQGFVAQARRTRDLWAGSYLLSYLSGKAMLATGGKIVFPAVDKDPLMQALRGAIQPSTSNIAAQVGSLPNRFVAEVGDAEAGERAKAAIQKTWEKIAKAVRDKYVTQTNPSPATESIWERQIKNTWDCAWVYGTDGTLLDQRKNLRTYFAPDEHGEKCTVCGERQEISGGGMGSDKSRNEMREWWKNFRRNAQLSVLDLREKERLCAVCLVKRLFPKVSTTAIGWQVPVGFPSVSYMAAVEWIEKVMKDGNKPGLDKPVEKFVTACMNAGVGKSEKDTRIAGISKKLESLQGNYWQTLADLDGSAFFEDSIRNQNSLSLKDDDKRNEIVSALKAVQQAIGSKATPFYALLLMDGDSMGALLSGKSEEEKEKVSAALGAFGKAVPSVVEECDGRLIYCGGDDVFALLPMERALGCARRCREAYQKAFQNNACFVEQQRATISASIVYAHIHIPLSVVVHQSHELLNKVAKKRTGRDAVACQVYKPGGVTLTWAMPWKKALEAESINKSPKQATLVEEVLTRFQDNSGDPTQFSSKFFYRMGGILELLSDEGGKLIFDAAATKKLLAAEYLANRELKWPDDCREEQEQRQEAVLRVGRLLALCTEYRRTLDTCSSPAIEAITETGRITDGALLVRFLAQKGVE